MGNILLGEGWWCLCVYIIDSGMSLPQHNVIARSLLNFLAFTELLATWQSSDMGTQLASRYNLMAISGDTRTRVCFRTEFPFGSNVYSALPMTMVVVVFPVIARSLDDHYDPQDYWVRFYKGILLLQNFWRRGNLLLSKQSLPTLQSHGDKRGHENAGLLQNAISV